MNEDQDYMKAFESYEKYLESNPIDEKVLEAYTIVACDVLDNKHDKENGLMIAKRAKEIIEQFIYNVTQGGTVWQLEKYAFENEVKFEAMEYYWKILLSEARSMILDSYFLYLERYRDPEDRFAFLHRREPARLRLRK